MLYAVTCGGGSCRALSASGGQSERPLDIRSTVDNELGKRRIAARWTDYLIEQVMAIIDTRRCCRRRQHAPLDQGAPTLALAFGRQYLLMVPPVETPHCSLTAIRRAKQTWDAASNSRRGRGRLQGP